MDWRMFFNKIKFIQCVKIFIGLLVMTGLILVLIGHNAFVSALLIYSLGVFISYMVTMGLYVFWRMKNHNIKGYYILDCNITLIIAAVFGYKFSGLFGFGILAILSYSILWAAYLWFKYRVFIKAGISFK